jgi:hypothetical protein
MPVRSCQAFSGTYARQRSVNDARAATPPCSTGGEMAERSKAIDSKSIVPLWHRGFESLSLRHPDCGAFMERCESGRIGAPGERVDAKSVPWVRIPPSPLWVVVLGGEVAVPCTRKPL